MTTLQMIELEAAETTLRLLMLLSLTLVIGFFVAAELAIVSASKSQLQKLAHQPATQHAAEQVQHAQANLEHYLSVTQTGTTAGSLLLGWLGEGATVHWIEPWIARLPLGHVPAMITTHSIATAIAFLLVTYVEIVLGELVPKVLAADAPESTAMLLIRPLQICAYLFFPALVLLNGTVKFLTGWIQQQQNRSAQSADSSEDEFSIVSIDAHCIHVSGSIDLDTLNQQFGLQLPTSKSYKTLAGFMIHRLGKVPQEHDRMQWDELELEAFHVIDRQLDTIVIRHLTRSFTESIVEPVMEPVAIVSSSPKQSQPAVPQP